MEFANDIYKWYRICWLPIAKNIEYPIFATKFNSIHIKYSVLVKLKLSPQHLLLYIKLHVQYTWNSNKYSSILFLLNCFYIRLEKTNHSNEFRSNFQLCFPYFLTKLLVAAFQFFLFTFSNFFFYYTISPIANIGRELKT